MPKRSAGTNPSARASSSSGKLWETPQMRKLHNEAILKTEEGSFFFFFFNFILFLNFT